MIVKILLAAGVGIVVAGLCWTLEILLRDPLTLLLDYLHLKVLRVRLRLRVWSLKREVRKQNEKQK